MVNSYATSVSKELHAFVLILETTCSYEVAPHGNYQDTISFNL